MKIWRNETEFDLERSVVALGTFDGVHLGHQALIRRARALADELHAGCVVCTFDRHPLSLICPERAPVQLTDMNERLKRFAALGVDGVLLKAFTREYAATDAQVYLEALVEALRVCGVVAGFNYSFGAGGRGDAALICREADRLHYRAEIVQAVHDGADTVSSTLIRALLARGELERAARLMALPEAEDAGRAAGGR